MPKPKIKPWSFSSLSSHATCARKYYEESIAKTVPYVETPEQALGTAVHKHFEDRLGPRKVPLPAVLSQHEPFMQEMEGMGGTILTERKVGLNRRLQPCEFWAKDVWWRGVIDVEVRLDDGSIFIVDYKTGKKKPKVDQLKLFSIYGIVTGAHTVRSCFYWTVDGTRTPYVMPREQLPQLLQGFVPDLRNYLESFKLDIWPPKRNGLCKNYCNVVGCEYRGLGMNE